MQKFESKLSAATRDCEHFKTKLTTNKINLLITMIYSQRESDLIIYNTIYCRYGIIPRLNDVDEFEHEYEYDDINNTNVFAVDDYYQSNGSLRNTEVVMHALVCYCENFCFF